MKEVGLDLHACLSQAAHVHVSNGPEELQFPLVVGCCVRTPRLHRGSAMLLCDPPGPS